MAPLTVRRIEKTPGVCGGRAVVTGTRLRVSAILRSYRAGMTVEEIVDAYPLRPSDVHHALAYAYDHPEEIKADLAADDEQAAQRLWPAT